MSITNERREYHQLQERFREIQSRAEEAEKLLLHLRTSVLQERRARRDYGDHLAHGTSPDTRVFADAWSTAQQAFDEVSWDCALAIEHLRKFGVVPEPEEIP